MNMNLLMQQAKKMQQEIAKKQANLEKKIFENKTNKSAINLKMNGKMEILELTISGDLMDEDSKDMLEDMLKISFKEVIKEIKDLEDSIKPKMGNSGF